jgi:hypothetical protein
MTGNLEQEVKRALDTFIADITRSAERAAIDGIRSAFVRASPRPDAAVTEAGDHVRVSDPSAHRRGPTATDRTSMRARVLVCIRENPGWDTTQLGRSLGSFPSKLRRPLRELANEGAIRFEHRSIDSVGPQRRVYGSRRVLRPSTYWRFVAI